MRAVVLTLAAGQSVPWRYHLAIADSFVCLEGPMVVEMRAPRANHVLNPGERCAVPPMRARCVHGKDDVPASSWSSSASAATTMSRWAARYCAGLPNASRTLLISSQAGTLGEGADSTEAEFPRVRGHDEKAQSGPVSSSLPLMPIPTWRR